MDIDSALLYFGLIFILFWNIVVWFYFIKSLYVYTWIKSRAEVIESTVFYDEGDGHGASYDVHARYSYHFAGKKYESNYVIYSGVFQFAREKEAEEELKTLIVGSTVDVFINRFNPKNAVLKRILPTKLIPFLIVGSFGLLVMLRISYKLFNYS